MSKTMPYLRLLRFPTVFTAMPDVLLGYALSHGYLTAQLDLAGLLVASSGLYLAGMVFNDVFDRNIDAELRPGRPIPSGAVSVSNAVSLGGVLITVGIVVAALVGVPSLIVAVLLTLCVFAYDGGLKRTPLGPIAMGGCRTLNVLLGASAVPELTQVWQQPQLGVALALGTYIIGVTWFARKEATQSPRPQLAGGMFTINLGFAGLVYMVAGTSHDWKADEGLVLAVLAVIVITINRRLSVAVMDPSPRQVQTAIKTLLLSLILLDAVMIYCETADPASAVATAALLIPAAFLGRWISVT